MALLILLTMKYKVAVQEYWIFLVSVYRSIAMRTISKIDLRNQLLKRMSKQRRVDELPNVLTIIDPGFVVESRQDTVEDFRPMKVSSSC